MAVKLRLMRQGKKKSPSYRIIATDSRNPRDGKYIEQVGFYSPINKNVSIDEEIAVKWLKNGAIPTDTVKSLLKKAGIMAKLAK